MVARMRAVAHQQERTVASGDVSGSVELRKGRETWTRARIAVRKQHRLQTHSGRAHIGRTQLEDVKILIEPSSPSSDVSVAEIPRDYSGRQRLHLISRREQSKVILKPLDIYRRIRRYF